MVSCDVVILGAGPYGLSAAAHLGKIKGLEFRVFGEPMSFWSNNMPAGMVLRSNWTATEIAGPNGSVTLEKFKEATGTPISHPVRLDHFVSYGMWFQSKAVPDLDRRKILKVEHGSNRFQLTTDTGEVITSRRVVIGAGISQFAWKPVEFRALPPHLASHTVEHQNLARFAGKTVLVVGSGQSAMESAALLHEAGAQVEMIARSQRIHWLQGRLSKTLHHGLGTQVRHLLYAPTDVGPAGLSQLMARPDLLQKLPRRLQERLRKRCVRPAGARWLVDRLRDVPMHLGTTVVSAVPTGDRVKLKLNDDAERTADHILLGTGYRIDIAKYDFLSPKLLEGIERNQGFPVLRRGLETSVPGLHILGAPAVWSFGPLLQFVSGTGYASRSLVRALAAKNSSK